jgi:hypothetical protein
MRDLWPSHAARPSVINKLCTTIVERPKASVCALKFARALLLELVSPIK